MLCPSMASAPLGPSCDPATRLLPSALTSLRAGMALASTSACLLSQSRPLLCCLPMRGSLLRRLFRQGSLLQDHSPPEGSRKRCEGILLSCLFMEPAGAASLLHRLIRTDLQRPHVRHLPEQVQAAYSLVQAACALKHLKCLSGVRREHLRGCCCIYGAERAWGHQAVVEAQSWDLLCCTAGTPQMRLSRSVPSNSA